MHYFSRSRVISVFVLVLLLMIVICDVTYGVRGKVETMTNDTISDNHTYEQEEHEKLEQLQEQEYEILKSESETLNNSNDHNEKNKSITKYISDEEDIIHVQHNDSNAEQLSEHEMLPGESLLEEEETHEHTMERVRNSSSTSLASEEIEETYETCKTRSLSVQDEIALYGSAMKALYVEHNLSLFVEHVQHGASRGHGRLQWLLGVLHANGVGVCKNTTRAFEYFKEAAQRGIPEAAIAVANHLYNPHDHPHHHSDHSDDNIVNNKTKIHGFVNFQNTATPSHRADIANMYFNEIGISNSNNNDHYQSKNTNSIINSKDNVNTNMENENNRLETKCKESLPYYRIAASHVLESYSPLYNPSHAPFPDKFCTMSFSLTRVLSRMIRVLRVVYTQVIVFMERVLPRLLLHSGEWLVRHAVCRFSVCQYVQEYIVKCYHDLYDTFKPVFTFINTTYSKNNENNVNSVNLVEGNEYHNSNFINRHPLRPTFTNEVMHQRRARLLRGIDKYSRHKREEKLDIEIYKADSGNTRSMIHLGYDYLFGRRGVKKDWRESKKFFERALNKGDNEAWAALGLLYLLGDPTTTPPLYTNVELAHYYFRKGAGQHSASALDALGFLHEAGYLYEDEIVDKALLESTHINVYAKTQTSPKEEEDENTKQEKYMKDETNNKEEVDQNHQHKSSHNTEHSSNNSHSSSFNFTKKKSNNDNQNWQTHFTPDYHSALKYYIRAFQLMHANTMYHFGKFALNGDHGVEQNPLAAEWLFEVMAAHNQPLAMWELGQLYEHRQECDAAVRQYDAIISLAPWYNSHSPTSNLITADWLDYDEEVVMNYFRENQFLSREEQEEEMTQDHNDAFNRSTDKNTMEFTEEGTSDSNWHNTHFDNSTHSHNETSHIISQHKLEQEHEELHHIEHMKNAVPKTHNVFAEIKFEAKFYSLRESLNNSETFTILVNSSSESSWSSSSSSSHNDQRDNVHNSHFAEFSKEFDVHHAEKQTNSYSNLHNLYTHIPRHVHAALQDKIREQHHIHLLHTRKLLLENTSTHVTTEEEYTENKEASKLSSSLTLSHVLYKYINIIRAIVHWSVNQFIFTPLRTLLYEFLSHLHKRCNALFSIVPQSWSGEWSLYSVINPPTTFGLFSRNRDNDLHTLHQHTQTQPFSSPFSPLALPIIEYSMYDTPLVWFIESLSMAETGHVDGVNNVIDILNNLVFVTGEKEIMSDEYRIASLLLQQVNMNNNNKSESENTEDNTITNDKEQNSAQHTDHLTPSNTILNFAIAPNIYINNTKQSYNALLTYLSSFMNEETILLHWTAESAMELVNTLHVHTGNITLHDAESLSSRLLSQREAKILLMVQHLESSVFKESHVARLIMGDIYFYGTSLLLGKNITNALEMYTEAAKLNEPEALFKLGAIYQLGLHKYQQQQQYQHPLEQSEKLKLKEHHRSSNTANKFVVHEKMTPAHQSTMELLLNAILRIIYHKPYANLSDLQVAVLSYSKMKSIHAEAWLLGQASLMLVNFQWWWMHFALQPHGLWQLYKLNMPFSDYVVIQSHSKEHQIDGLINNNSTNSRYNDEDETIRETQQTYNLSSRQVRLKRPFQLSLNVQQIRLATMLNETTSTSYNNSITNTTITKTNTFFSRVSSVASVPKVIKIVVTSLWTRVALLLKDLMYGIRLFVKFQWNMVAEPFIIVWHFAIRAAHVLVTEISLAAVEMYTFILSLTLLIVTLFILHYYG